MVAAANVTKLRSELEYAKYQERLSKDLATKGAGPAEDVQKWSAQVATDDAAIKGALSEEQRARYRYESEIGGVNTTVAARKAALDEALYYLDNTTMVAPEDGYIINLQVRPGMVAGDYRMGAIASFICDADRYLLATYFQENLKYVKPGQSIEAALDLYPGQIWSGKVVEIWQGSGAGQMIPSGTLPDFAYESSKVPQGRFAVVIDLDGHESVQVSDRHGRQGRDLHQSEKPLCDPAADRHPSVLVAELHLPILGVMRRRDARGRWAPSRPWRRGLATLAMLAGSTLAADGCALSTPPTRTDVVTRALPKPTRIPPSWSATTRDDSVRNDWLRTFNDPRLDSLVAEAIAHNLDLRQAIARVEIARQTVAVVGAQLSPQVNGQVGAHATVDDTRPRRPHRHEQPPVRARLLGAGSLGTTPRAAGGVGGIVSGHRARLRLRSPVVGGDDGQVLVSRDRDTPARRAGGAVRRRPTRSCSRWCRIRRAAGKVADLDVAEASANLNVAETALSVARGRYSEARRALELLLGRYPSAEIDISARFATLPAPVAPGLPTSLLARRPDIMAAERQVLAAFRTEEAARLALLPTISLALDGGRLADKLLSLLHLNPWLVHSAIGAAVPIYEGGALRADIRIATAEQEQAVAHYGAVVLRAFGEVESALTNEGLLAQQSLSDQRALDDRIAAVRIAAIKYNVGTIDLLSVLILQASRVRVAGLRHQAAERPTRQPHRSAPRPWRRLRRRASRDTVTEELPPSSPPRRSSSPSCLG